MTGNTDRQVFHAGEIYAQRKAGYPDFAERIKEKGFVRSAMPDQHRTFFENLPMITTGLLDQSGRPWATAVFGKPGSFQSPEPDILAFSSLPALSRLLELDTTVGAKIGLCGVEMETRRRNRMNGTIVNNADSLLAVEVDQSYGNCPQYIQKRDSEWCSAESETLEPAKFKRGKTISKLSQSIIEASDTFFIASRAPAMSDDPRGGIDVSHRGGKPGFVRTKDDTVSFPDFSGNRFFNTIGNIESDGRAGLFFPDFETGDAVFLTGKASVSWDDSRIAAFDGAERIIDVVVDEIISVRALLPIKAKLLEQWPVLEETGTWQQAGINLLKKDGYRKFAISEIQRESELIKSFYLRPSDGGLLEQYLPGQFLPIRIPASPDAPELLRSYTISKALDDHDYRLSIKREPQGKASRWFHDDVSEGTTVEVGTPAGDFFLADNERSVVFLSGGVGITPMIAMMQGLEKIASQNRNPGKVWFLHGTKNSETFAFREYLLACQSRYDWLTVNVYFSEPTATDMTEPAFGSHGRIDMNSLRALLPFDNYEFYLCGPDDFIQSLYGGLREFGIELDHIHHEYFGEELLETEEDSANDANPFPQGAVVDFRKSGLTENWEAQSRTLLELAESIGLTPLKNCRGGKCGTCATRLISGTVRYRTKPVFTPKEGEVLICCSEPAKPEETVVLDI